MVVVGCVVVVVACVVVVASVLASSRFRTLLYPLGLADL